MLEGFFTTAKGTEYFAKAAAGKKLKFTIGKFGNGVLDEAVNPATVTEMVNTLGTLPIARIRAEGNKTTVTTSFSNRVGNSILPEFNLTEVGLYGRIETDAGAVDPEGTEALLLYSYTTPAKSDFIPGTLTEYTISFPIIMSGSVNVTAIIDESLVYPTLGQYIRDTFFKVSVAGTGASIEATDTELGLADGLGLTVKLVEDMEDNATLSLNDSATYPIKNMNGEAITAGAIAGAYINVVFSAEDQCWYLIGGTGGGGSSTDLVDTEEPINIIGDPPEVDPVVQSAINEHADNTNNPHGVTAAQAGAVALDGSGVMTGDFKMTKDYPEIRLENTHSNRSVIMQGYDDYVEFGDYVDDTNHRLLRIKPASEDVITGVALIEMNGGEWGNYNLFGEHNKPYGAYHGNGNATSRTISTNAIGRLLMVYSSIGIAFVTPQGAIVATKSSKTIEYLPPTEAKYTKGVLTLATTHNVLNYSDYPYEYECK